MNVSPTRSLNIPGVFNWLLAYGGEEVELTIEGPTGLMLDGTGRIEGFRDCLPGDVPTICWVQLWPDLRLWLNVRQIERADLDEASDELTVTFGPGECWRLRPL